MEKLNELTLKPNYKIVSFNVVPMNANSLSDLAVKSIERRWSFIRNTKIPKTKFIKAIKIILNSTFFVFDKKIFK